MRKPTLRIEYFRGRAKNNREPYSRIYACGESNKNPTSLVVGVVRYKDILNMGLMFVKKKIHDLAQEPVSAKESQEDVVSKSLTISPKEPVAKNKKGKERKNMITAEQLAAVEAAAEELVPKVKKVKSDRGLIERTESSKIILAEDNRQLLKD